MKLSIKEIKDELSRNGVIGKLKLSSSVRIGRLCRKLLEGKGEFSPSGERKRSLMFTVSGKDHQDMLYYNLKSLNRSQKTIPQIKVVSDGTLSVRNERIDFRSENIDIVGKSKILQYQKRKGRKELVKFAKDNALGLKLASIIAIGEKQGGLFFDSDVLWYKKIDKLLKKAEEEKLVVSRDYQKSYGGIEKRWSFGRVNGEPINSGLVYVDGNIYDECQLAPLIKEASRKADHFSEQAIIAAAAQRLDAPIWSQSDVACFQSDSNSLTPTFLGKSWIARHYVRTVRHLFWRDALALELGFR